MESNPTANRDYHPAVHHPASGRSEPSDGPDQSDQSDWSPAVEIPRAGEKVILDVGGTDVSLSNLGKVFWPELGITKGELLQYYADISPALLPHLRDRAMVMKRYPHGATGEFFYMKRCPKPRPDWIELCSISHGSGNIIDFPMIQDLPSLLWVINLGCIDLNQWYARCDDVDRPDFLHFDLDPGPGVEFPQVRECALIVRAGLEAMGAPVYAKSTGSKGMHLYVPIERGPKQKQVWTFAKAFANVIAEAHPDLMTAVYRIADRPPMRVLVDYNQNAWGRTLASIYSVRPTPFAGVSTPLTWEEIEQGADIRDFHLRNVPDRVREIGDLWAPLISPEGRVALESLR